MEINILGNIKMDFKKEEGILFGKTVVIIQENFVEDICQGMAFAVGQMEGNIKGTGKKIKW